MRVAVMRAGQTIKELDIEPIAIKEIAHGFAGHLEFDRILTQQARMIEMLDKIALTVSENQTRTNAVVFGLAKENLKVLWKNNGTVFQKHIIYQPTGNLGLASIWGVYLIVRPIIKVLSLKSNRLIEAAKLKYTAAQGVAELSAEVTGNTSKQFRK